MWCYLRKISIEKVVINLHVLVLKPSKAKNIKLKTYIKFEISSVLI